MKRYVIGLTVAGVQPWWIQGNLKGRQHWLGEIYLFRDIKRDQEKIVYGENRGEKRLKFLGLHRKPIKPQDKGLAQSTQATGARLNSRGCPTWGSLSHGSQKPRQISIHGEPLCSRWEFSLKRENKKITTWGSQASEQDPQLYFQRQLIYPKLYIKK